MVRLITTMFCKEHLLVFRVSLLPQWFFQKLTVLTLQVTALVHEGTVGLQDALGVEVCSHAF